MSEPWTPERIDAARYVVTYVTDWFAQTFRSEHAQQANANGRELLMALIDEFAAIQERQQQNQSQGKPASASEGGS